MELNILENTKTNAKFEIIGESHTFCNILKEELWNDEDVKVSAYNIRHPLIGNPLFIVETNGKKTALEAVQDAIKRLLKDAETIKKEAAKELK